MGISVAASDVRAGLARFSILSGAFAVQGLDLHPYQQPLTFAAVILAGSRGDVSFVLLHMALRLCLSLPHNV